MRIEKNHNKKPFDNNNKDNTTKTTKDISTTDPDSGVFHKGEHKRCFAYSAQTACEKTRVYIRGHISCQQYSRQCFF